MDLVMPHDGYSTPSLPVTEWAQNASGGRVSVDDPYQLRELLARLAVEIDLPDFPGDLSPNSINGGGRFTFYK